MNTTETSAGEGSAAALAAGIDWDASRERWIREARAAWAPRLSNDPRFPDGRKLLKRFDLEIETWRTKKAEGFTFRQLINFGNELGAAVGLLDHVTDLATLRYEPRIPGVPKTLDFLLLDAEGRRAWIDVKTVAPQWVDDDAEWKRFQAIARKFPGNARLVVDRVFGGAGIGGQSIKTRWSFVTRTLEVEHKAALIPEQMRGPVWLLFCSDRFAWHPDDLADFADMYRSGRFRDDDWSRNEVSRYMKEKNLAMSGTLSGFHYLGRGHDEVAVDLRFRVRGPEFFAPEIGRCALQRI
jgi:hypothetical protein